MKVIKGNMKKTLLTIMVAVLACAACTSKTSQTTGDASNGEYETNEEKADGIQRMHEYNYSDTLVIEGLTYNYSIHREASDSLPMVTDDEGTRYADNIYTLSLFHGTDIAQFRFTKRTFASYLSPEFREKGILDGMMYDSSLPGLHFAVSVSLPQSDMFEPLLLTLDPNGGMSISRDERSEVDYAGEEEGV